MGKMNRVVVSVCFQGLFLLRIWQSFLLHLRFRYNEKRWDPKQLIGSGGMPSSHSTTVTTLSVAIGFQDGFGSSLFATTTIFASVVMYDAYGVRLHAGKQAAVLNQIVCELPAEHPLAETRPLRELLGHTLTQDIRWKSKLGGLEMEMRLVNYFAGQFNKKLGNGDDIRHSRSGWLTIASLVAPPTLLLLLRLRRLPVPPP